MFKEYLWNARIDNDKKRTDVVFIPRPPELIALASTSFVTNPGASLVYPDPPLSAEERDLFATVNPALSLRSYTDWAAEHGGSP